MGRQRLTETVVNIILSLFTRYRKVLKVATTKLKWTLLGDNITVLALLAKKTTIRIKVEIVIKGNF